MRKAVMVIFSILSLLVIIQVIEVTDANPWWIFKTIAPLPSSVPPKITIDSPQNNTLYHSDKIDMNFKVAQPEVTSDKSIEPFVDNIKVFLDEKLIQEINQFRDTPLMEFKSTLNLSSTGAHNLTIAAEGVALIHTSMTKFWINNNSTVFFSSDQPITVSPTEFPYPLVVALFIIMGFVVTFALVSKIKYLRAKLASKQSSYLVSIRNLLPC